MSCRPAHVVATLCLMAILATGRPATAAAAPDEAIRQVMNASASAWSAGDLDRFMDAYADSPDTIFIAKDGVIHGKAAIRAMYASRFAGSRPGELGQLSVDFLEIRPLGATHALLVGRYHLRPPQPDQPEATGVFTLLFDKRGGRWRIVCDHTS